jgi:hypothetical protein
MSETLSPWEQIHDEWAEMLDNGRDCLTLLERIEVMLKPFTATAAVASRIRELGISADELADRAGLSRSAVRHFGLCPHSRSDLERISVALDWPPNHLEALYGSPE